MSGALPPLFERLSAEADERPAFDDRALAESVRGELLRLLNTRRPANARSGILAYGLADWTAVQRLRAEDRPGASWRARCGWRSSISSRACNWPRSRSNLTRAIRSACVSSSAAACAAGRA